MIEPKYGLPEPDPDAELKNSVTSNDHTPYAEPGENKVSWFRMCRYVYTAGNQRLSHLALTRTSPASRRFAWRAILLFSCAVTLFVVCHYGWFELVLDPTQFNPPLQPEGRGWVRLVQNQANAEGTFRGSPPPVSYWWNITTGAILIPCVFSISLLTSLWILSSYERGLERALTPEYKDQGRFGAAIRYGTGWWLGAILAGFLMLFVPLYSVARVFRFSFVPTPTMIYVLGAVLVSISAFMWWFFLVRIAGTVPPQTRSRVMWYCSVWGPVKTLIILGIPGAAFYFGIPRMITLLRLTWELPVAQ